MTSHFQDDDTVTATDLSNFELFAQYAGAAYCNCEETAVDQPVTCDADVCPTVESDRATVVQVYAYVMPYRPLRLVKRILSRLTPKL